ncbi:uncharacterized protein METZ01_LOCUS242081 [marine metagenome]|uniref:Uncharacterized protein n=1 Tax=marine metagenome TaxID=408172 RepID=A0A382HQJ0_9ZZZZ
MSMKRYKIFIRAAKKIRLLQSILVYKINHGSE